MSDANVREIARLNGQAGKHWECEHLLNGFWAATAPQYIKGQTPYYENDDVITFWAYSRQLVLRGE